MRITTLLFMLVLCISCQTHKKEEYFEIKIASKTVVGIFPDSLQLSKMEKEYGEDDFFTIIDDVIWYDSQMREVIDSLKIKFVDTDKRLIRITTPNDHIEINNDTSQVKWRYVYFDGKEILERDVFYLIDLGEAQE